MKKKIPWLFLTIFLTVMVLGLLLGEYKNVLQKAVMVCLACIGIG